MSEAAKRTRGKSEKRRRKEREEKFFGLVDRAQELVEETINSGEHDIKDLKQITGALKDLKDLLFDKADKGGEKGEEMVIKIEGDVEQCSP